MVLATTGLERMIWGDRISEKLDPAKRMLPADIDLSHTVQSPCIYKSTRGLPAVERPLCHYNVILLRGLAIIR